MSIETLKLDMAAVAAAAKNLSLLTSVSEITEFLRDNLVPLLGTAVDHVGELDDVVDALADQSSDVLHEESAACIAALVAAVGMLATELRTRAGSDARILKIIKEALALVPRVNTVIEEALIVEDEEDEEDDEEQNDDEGGDGGTAPPAPALGGGQ